MKAWNLAAPRPSRWSLPQKVNGTRPAGTGWSFGFPSMRGD